MLKRFISRRLLAAALSFVVAASAPAAGTNLDITEQDSANSGIVEQTEQQEPQSAANIQSAASEENVPVEDTEKTEPTEESPAAVSEEISQEDDTIASEESLSDSGDDTVNASEPEKEKSIALAAKPAGLQALTLDAQQTENDNEQKESVSISVVQDLDNYPDGNKPKIIVTTSGLDQEEQYKYQVNYKKSTASNYTPKTQYKLPNDSTFTLTNQFTVSADNSYNIYVALYNSSGEDVAHSETVTITAVKPSISNADYTINSSIEGQSTGSISFSGNYKYLAYYPKGKYASNAIKVLGTTIEGLAAGEYYIFIPPYSDGNTYYLKSNETKPPLEVGSKPVTHYSVTFESDERSSWSDGDKTDSVIQGLGQTLEYQVAIDSGFKNTHVLDSVTVQPQNAVLSIDKESDTVWNVTVSEITGDVTVTAASKPIPEYTVTLAPAEGAKWTGGGSQDSFIIKTSGYKSVYVKPTDSERYYISGVSAQPEGKADITFSNSTGEVYVTNVTGDITITPQVVEKSIPYSINVTGVHFNENGNYSEENPSIQVTFTVEVKDQFGETVPGAIVYFKDDESEVSFVQSRKTDSQGTAELIYSYGIGEDETSSDYNAIFSTDSNFDDVKPAVSQDIHLVLQRKADLILYEDQIVGTAPDENNGKVINIPDNYEIWTGEVHQGALVIGSGEWVSPVNGEFTGLSSGQHILRAGEYVDEDTNTFYFASDYADFFVPRGVWTVTADTAGSENVVFTGETEQTAEPGGTVYVYVEPEEGFEIVSYTVDKPSRVSGVNYYEEAGYVAIEGVTGNIVLTVKAEKDEEDPQEPNSIEYIFLEGSGSTWIKGSNVPQRFRANGDYDKFTSAKVDGVEINDYTSESGSTIIYLSPEYLETLALGSHVLTLDYTDGTASGTFNVKQSDVKGAEDTPSKGSDAPKTGDPADGIVIALMTAALLLSAAVLIIMRIDDTWLISVIRYIK